MVSKNPGGINGLLGSEWKSGFDSSEKNLGAGCQTGQGQCSGSLFVLGKSCHRKVGKPILFATL